MNLIYKRVFKSEDKPTPTYNSNCPHIITAYKK